MTIESNEIVFRSPANRSDSAANGGRVTTVLIPDATKNNILPSVKLSERTAGILRYRKVFAHLINQEGIALEDPKFFVDIPTPGGDSVTFFPGTHVDVQSGITGTERLYGGGKLNANVSVGGTTITVLTEAASLNIFRAGDIVRITDMARYDSPTGNVQYVTITGTTPTYAANVCTFTITTPLEYNFAAATTRVASCYKPANMNFGYASFVVNTVGNGDYNAVAYPPIANNLGAEHQSWTCTVTNTNKLTIVGDTFGNMGEYPMNANITVNHPTFLVPMFTLRLLGFSGAWANGDTITFTTSPAKVPLWIRHNVPAGTNDIAGSQFVLGLDGDSQQ